jgi:hypothetical protein
MPIPRCAPPISDYEPEKTATRALQAVETGTKSVTVTLDGLFDKAQPCAVARMNVRSSSEEQTPHGHGLTAAHDLFEASARTDGLSANRASPMRWNSSGGELLDGCAIGSSGRTPSLTSADAKSCPKRPPRGVGGESCDRKRRSASRARSHARRRSDRIKLLLAAVHESRLWHETDMAAVFSESAVRDKPTSRRRITKSANDPTGASTEITPRLPAGCRFGCEARQNRWAW